MEPLEMEKSKFLTWVDKEGQKKHLQSIRIQ